MEEKVTWREQIGAILVIVTFGYWFRIGQHWADHDVNQWKKLFNWIKEHISKKDEVPVEPEEDWSY